MVRTRIAPSPTGEDLHIGNVYTALLNYAFAKKNKGKFIIRIEDTDRTRFVAGAQEKILSSLQWFGLSYDEGPDIGGPFAPYRQSESKDSYRRYAEELISSDHAYYCFCSPQRLDELRHEQQKKGNPTFYDGHCRQYSIEVAREKAKTQSFVIRLKVPKEGTTMFTDVLRGNITFENKLIDDQVLLKSDGFPTYHLGVVVDDNRMEITHVIRAEEWISSTPKHILLYTFFGWKQPIFAHTPILRNPDKSKLSKRKNPVWAVWYKEQGFLPEATINYLSLMGWSHPSGKEIFSLNEFVSVFKLEDIKPVGPIFDIKKLEWLNGLYIRSFTVTELAKRLIERNEKLLQVERGKLEKLIELARTRMERLNQFDELVHHFLYPLSVFTYSENEKHIANALYNKLLELTEWESRAILEVLRVILKQYAIKMSVIYKLITGSERGLPLPETIELLGKEEVINRLQKALK